VKWDQVQPIEIPCAGLRMQERAGRSNAYAMPLNLALAEVLDARLVTRDRRIATAAGHHARVEFV
jgi:hypothetical protein